MRYLGVVTYDPGKTMRSATIVAIGALTLAACGGGGVSNAPLDTFNDSASYAIGMNMAASLDAAKADVNLDALLSGFSDYFNEAVLDVPEEQAGPMIQAFVAVVQERQQADMAAQAEGNIAEGQSYREANGARSEVTTTASGLQFEVLEPGTGETPGENSEVTVHYRGTLIDGTEFDSSYPLGQPARFPINRVISGWTEALKMMNVGGKYRLVIPPELAYGVGGSPPDIGPNATLVFEIQLIEFEG
ncbi:MAG: FKBP-type peptidyl-prolyl cis-trans isomerase [Gemmatimonadales bacterium]